MCEKSFEDQAKEASSDGMSDPLSAQLPPRIRITGGRFSYEVCKILQFFYPLPLVSSQSQ